MGIVAVVVAFKLKTVTAPRSPEVNVYVEIVTLFIDRGIDGINVVLFTIFPLGSVPTTVANVGKEPPFTFTTDVAT